MTMEVNIVTGLLFLNTLGWSIAWMLFRNQFSALSAKVDALFKRLDDINTRLIKTEVHIDHLTKLTDECHAKCQK